MAGVKPELEIFDGGMMNNEALLAEEGVFKALLVDLFKGDPVTKGK